MTKLADGAGVKESGGITMVDVHTLLEACDLPDPLMLFLMVKSKTSDLETTFYKCRIIRISALLGIKIKQILLYLSLHHSLRK
jgi:hypothetical protein